MRLPETLSTSIAEEVERIPRAELSRAATNISARYRAGDFARSMTPSELAAYLLTRLPATYAANAAVFREFKRRINGAVHSLLDLGAGPGTSMWAAAEAIPGISRFTNLERDENFQELGKRFAQHSSNAAVRDARWVSGAMRATSPPAHDVVVMSYSLGELSDPQTSVSWAFALADVALIVIEPGTPAGFAKVLQAREELIRLQGRIAAPCPHHNQCPLAVRNDWCHFSVRLERTSAHRQLKGGELGYEDEKFSYVIASKADTQPAQTRIVRHPQKHPGHVKLTLCATEDLEQSTVGKSQKDLYRAARKAEWGDEWPSKSSPVSG